MFHTTWGKSVRLRRNYEVGLVCLWRDTIHLSLTPTSSVALLSLTILPPRVLSSFTEFFPLRKNGMINGFILRD